MSLMRATLKSSVFLALGLLLQAIPCGASTSLPRKSILMLFPYESNMPGFIDFDAGFRSTLNGSRAYNFDFYIESMDLTRFPSESHFAKLEELFREKYSALKPDLILACLHPSLDFLEEHSPESLRGVPIVFSEQDPRLYHVPTSLPLAAEVEGRLDLMGTLSLALRLQPHVRNVYVVTGASQFDRSLEAMAREVLKDFENQVRLQYLAALPMEDLIHRISNLPAHSLVLYVAVFQDGNGERFKSPEALALLAKRANAPIYGITETYIDAGIVGGHLLSHFAEGAAAARVALRIFAGQKPDPVDTTGESMSRYIFDARQLKRWGIREEDLPLGSEVRYKDLSVWETYPWQITGVVSLLILQAFLISSLVLSSRRQRRAERRLQRAADEWQTTFDSITDLIMLLDPEFRIVRVNAAVASFTGLPMDAILGKRCHRILHGTSAVLAECPCAKVLETRSHQDALFFDEKREAWLSISVDPIFDENQEITGFIHTVKNVTERKRAAEAVEASEAFNRAVLASLKSSIAILDKHGTIVSVNEAWEQFALQNGALSPAEAGAGVNYLDVCRRSVQMPGDLVGQAFSGILSVLDGKSEVFELEYPCNSPSESRWFSMRVTPFAHDEGGAVVSHTDITLRRKALLEARSHREELAHVTRIITIGELATSLAHEINQPLTAMLCNAEAAQRFLSNPEPDLDEVRTILGDIIQDDKRAGEVIRRMRTLVKKEMPQRETMNLNDAVRETVALVRNASFLEGVTITAELDPELPAVQSDRVQLQQVIMNLLLNATAAMKDTPPALRQLVIKTALQESRAVKVSVRDSGSGIEEKDISRLFEPFYTTKSDGLGMGLSISRTIIKAHGGTIRAENNPEGGATFTFSLPLHCGAQP